MFFIEDDIIYITRGDDAELNVTISNNEFEEYTMEEGDKLVLTVREIPDILSPVLLSIESPTNCLSFSHEDTAGLEVGRYSADIELRDIEGKRVTIYPDLKDANRYKVKNYKNFIIMPEVTINE